MKKTLLLLMLISCTPTHIDASISFGENQKIDKHLTVSHRDNVEEDEAQLIVRERPMPPTN